MDARVIAADWLFPVVSPPISRGAVVLAGSEVAWLGTLSKLPGRWAGLPVERLRGAITPGLVNAHTHLQYTHFDPLGRGRYPSFEQWAYAFETAYDAVPDGAYWGASARAGARQAIASGCTVFAEVITDDEARGALAECGVTGIEYLEAIGWHARSWQGGGREAFLARLERPGPTTVGISPHAPYSLDGAVIEDLAEIADERSMRLHLHVAESSVEDNLYRFGDQSVLEIYGDQRHSFDLVRRGGSGQRAAFYADSVSALRPTTHVAHAIYLDRAGRDLLLRRGCQVALCPRSNAALGLGPAPVASYLQEGHEIAVGTDSLASAPSLDLMADVAMLAQLARQQGYLDDDLPARLLRAATLGGAKAMGLDRNGYGVLAPGGPADLAAFDVRLPGRSSSGGRHAPLAEQMTAEQMTAELVAGGGGRCTLTVAAGAVLHRAKTRSPLHPHAT